MSNFRFFLDTYPIDEPIGWDTLQFNVSRDLDNNFVYSRVEGSLKFVNSSYNYLNQIRLDNLYCNSVELRIEIKCADTNQYIDYFNTIIYLINCEFNTFRCEVTVPIKDNGWATKIQKNKNIETYINTNLTKNLTSISGIAPSMCVVFAPNGGAFYPVPITGLYRVYEVLFNLVKFMSDGTATLQSNYFSTGLGSDLYIVSGQNVRTKTLDINSIFPPKISFEALYNALRCKYNIGMSVVEINGTITIIIEDISYFYNSNSIFTLLNIKDEIRYYKSERIFSSVNFGNDEYLEQAQCDNGNGICTFPQYDLKMFANENFGILGDCNVDRVLQLSSTNRITSDANVIEDCVVFGNTSHDQSTILIQCDNTNPLLVAKKTQFALPTTYVYNYDLRNEACAARWLNYGICNRLASYFYSFDADIQLWNIRTYGLCFSNWAGSVFNTFINAGDIIFDQVNSNPNSLYNTLTGQATIVMPGIYRISAQSQIVATVDLSAFGCGENLPADFAIAAYMVMNIYDANGNLIYTTQSNTFDHQSFFEIFPADNAYLTIAPNYYQMDAGYYVKCQLYLFQYDLPGTPNPKDEGCNVVIYDDIYSYFICDEATQIDSGDYPIDPDNCKVEAARFKKFLSFDELQTLKQSPAASIDYTIGINNEPTRTGFISESSTNLKTLESEFDLLLI
jgi:hypothetical protein